MANNLAEIFGDITVVTEKNRIRFARYAADPRFVPLADNLSPVACYGVGYSDAEAIKDLNTRTTKWVKRLEGGQSVLVTDSSTSAPANATKADLLDNGYKAVDVNCLKQAVAPR